MAKVKPKLEFPGSINQHDVETIGRFVELRAQVDKICKKCKGMGEWIGPDGDKFKTCADLSKHPVRLCVLVQAKRLM